MGTRLVAYVVWKIFEDHPHAYGDKVESAADDTVASGSSPRVWGQEGSALRIVAFAGIIPTRMGTR